MFQLFTKEIKSESIYKSNKKAKQKSEVIVLEVTIENVS